MLRRISDISDAELDLHIITRLELLGVDLSVLPEFDPDAPADLRRILESARIFLRSAPSIIADFPFDQNDPPMMYPSSWAARERRDW